MESANTRRIAIPLIVIAAMVIVLLVRHFSGNVDGSARAQFLRFVPADTTSVVFADFDQLRTSPFLAALASWASQPSQDSEYSQFVRDTGFDYERDIHKAFVAISNHGATSSTLALADGNFDRAKIEAFLSRTGKSAQQGSLKVFVLPPGGAEKPLTVAFLAAQRIAITNSENLFAALSNAVRQPGRAEWETRFDRLAGTPAFAVIRQDPALQNAIAGVAPGGFRSPQLGELLGQLQWISIGAKPEGDVMRFVADAECPSDTACSQLRDFLQGIQVLAQNGLNDPKLRQQMNPEERHAYLELVKSADIEKISRPDAQSIRLVLAITPRLLNLARLASINPPAEDADAKPASRPASSHKKKPPK